MWEQDGGVLSRSKERRVFLFEQTVIFSELLRKGSNNPGYQFKNSIKVRRVLLLLHVLFVRQSEWAVLVSSLTSPLSCFLLCPGELPGHAGQRRRGSLQVRAMVSWLG